MSEKEANDFIESVLPPDEEVERARKILYADKTDAQIIMIALSDILRRIGGAPVIIRELNVRYRKEEE